MHDLIGAVVEGIAKVDRVESAWQIVGELLACDLLVDAHG
jgi:hypothetical protein